MRSFFDLSWQSNLLMIPLPPKKIVKFLGSLWRKFKHIRLKSIFFQCQVGCQTTLQKIFLFVWAIFITPFSLAFFPLLCHPLVIVILFDRLVTYPLPPVIFCDILCDSPNPMIWWRYSCTAPTTLLLLMYWGQDITWMFPPCISHMLCVSAITILQMFRV